MSTGFATVRKLLNHWGYALILVSMAILNVGWISYWQGPMLYLIPSLSGFLTMIICSVGEKFLIFRLRWKRSFKEALGDFIQTSIVLPIIVGLCCLIWKALAGELGLRVLLSKYWWPEDTLWVIHFLSALLISEFLFYWIHRFGHVSRLLWYFHRYHHSAVKLDWYNSGQFHPLDLFLNFIFYFAPYFLFPIPESVLVVVLSLNVVTGLLEHANIDLRSGFLNRIFNTAELHRWHHSIIPKESMMNYGKVLSIWDSCFGTYKARNLKDLKEIGIDSFPS